MAHCKVYGLSAVSCKKMAVPIEIQFGMLNWVCPGNHVIDRSAHCIGRCANTIEPSMCGSDAGLCHHFVVTQYGVETA